jgi:hypothetical protein
MASLRRRVGGLALLLACCWGTPARTEEAPASEHFRAFAALPGAVVTEMTVLGERAYQVEVGGVVLHEVRIGREASTGAEDRSGHGAVLCAWHSNILVRSAIDLCHPGEHGELREDADAAIRAITDFIVANDPLKGSRQLWEGRVQGIEDEMRRRAAVLSTGRTRRCPVMRDIMQRASSTTREQRQQQLAHLLSAPRPPVMEPCM